MSIWHSALQWFDQRFDERPIYLFTSRFYPATESWSKTPVWWFCVPLKTLEERFDAFVYFLAEKPAQRNEFHLLKIPVEYFLEHRASFTLLAGKNFNLMLSADEPDFLCDVRGKGRIDFSSFCNPTVKYHLSGAFGGGNFPV